MLAHHLPLGAERRDEGGEHDQPGIGHQLGHLADAADVLHPVGIGEAQVRFRPWRTLSPSSRKCAVHRAQLLFDQIGDGRLAGAGQAGEPQHRRLLALQPRRMRVSRVTSSACQWMFCARRSAKWIMPAPTVALVILSIRMKPPVSRFSA
jgi:hypothetical protein